MKARTWIVIGIVLSIFTIINYHPFWISVFTGNFLSTLHPTGNSLVDGTALLIVIFIPCFLSILSVLIIYNGLKKRRVENSLSTLPFSNTLKDKVEEKENSALEILKKRYASGNISEEEFNKMKENLDKK